MDGKLHAIPELPTYPMNITTADFDNPICFGRLCMTKPDCQLPKTIVCDNGPELTCKAMYFWSQRRGVKLHFIQPGKPNQNAFVESFNGKFRSYCLDMHWFSSIDDARTTIDNWRYHYKHEKPHRTQGKPPAVFAAEVA